VTDTKKTANLGFVSQYIFEDTGLPSHLIVTDNAGLDTVISEVESGLIIPYRIVSQRKFLIRDFSLLSQGWWPKDIHDPLSELLPPNFEEFGALLWDGWTSTSEMLMEVHESAITVRPKPGHPGVMEMEATNVKVAEMPKDSFIYSGEGDSVYARRSTGRSDFGAVQGRAREFMRNLSQLPIPTVCTALECRGEDKENNSRPIYGPQFAGSALTGHIGGKFANLLHMALLPKEEAVIDPSDSTKKIRILGNVPVMYTTTHYRADDPLKVPYPSVVRAPKVPELLARIPKIGPPRIDLLFKLLDELFDEERRMLLDKYKTRIPVSA